MDKYQRQIVQFKIFGERHTASNVLAKFLIDNFDLDYPYYDFLGWKHRKAPTRSELENKPLVARTLFIILVRHPHEWAAAMHRWSYADYDSVLRQVKLSFPRFLTYPIGDYANVLDMWNQKYKSYIEFLDLVPYSVIVRYEDFKKDQLSILEDICKWLPKPDHVETVQQYLHGGDTWMLHLTERQIGQFRYSHWLQSPPSESELSPIRNREPLAKITPEIMRMIDRQLDKSVLNYYYPERV